MDTIEKKISNLIESQFPYFMQEEGPVLIEFVKKYYEWMESQGQSIYQARHLPAYKDIDTTVSQFLIYFKEKYLKNIQFQTEVSTRRMVKHSLDLYRSKGTERAIDLMFKAVFNTPAEVYLPGRDIFRLSSGDYYKQYYLEVTPLPINITFVNKQVTGTETGATAFVEKLIRKKIKNSYVEVFIISALNGHFRTGEVLKLDGQQFVQNNPKVTGSLTHVQVLSGSANYEIGDIVELTSTLGVGAKGRVTSIADVTGQVSFELIDGGFGYTSQPQIYISEKVLRLSNVQVNSAATGYFNDFDTITAPQGQINFTGATGEFTIGSNVYTYHANGDVKGVGVIQGITFEGSTNTGYLFVTVANGDLNDLDYYSYGNTITAIADVVPYQDKTATAQVIGIANNIVIDYNDAQGAFRVNDVVYQLDNNNLKTAVANVISSVTLGRTGSITVTNPDMPFIGNTTIYVEGSNNTANVVSQSMDIGVILATPNTILLTNVSSTNTTYFISSTVGVFPGSDVQLIDPSFTITNASSVGTQVTVSNTANIITGSPVTIVTGNGTLASNTSVSSISNSTVFVLSTAPTVALSDATIRVSSALGNTDGNVLVVNSVVNSTAFTVEQPPSIALSNASIYIIPPDFQFYSNTGNFIYSLSYSNTSYSNATITAVSTGVLANFSVTSSLSFPETIMLNNTFIAAYRLTPLAANNYLLKPTLVTNVNSIIADALTFDQITIGRINQITGINSGYDYNFAPVVKIKEPLIADYEYVDVRLELTNQNGSFYVGDIIRQPSISNNNMGLVLSSNSTSAIVRRISFENDFNHAVTNTTVVSVTSGATADITYVSRLRRTDEMGYNAIVSSNVVSQSGSVTSIEVVDSGFAYEHQEFGNFTQEGKGQGTVVMLLGTNTEEVSRQGREGKTLGVYQSEDGFLSNQKKLHDGHYYQEFSYEVRSSITLDKYEAMLKQLLHVAGTKYFAATVRSSVLPIGITIDSLYEPINVTTDKTTIVTDTDTFTIDTLFV